MSSLNPRPSRPNRNTSPFDSIMHTNEDRDGNPVEWWSARELMVELGYSDWRNFLDAIDRAKAACRCSDGVITDHFVDATKMIDLPKNAVRSLEDVHMSRYGCYLTAMSGDSRKERIAAALRYFALRTRQAELASQVLAPPEPAVQPIEPWAKRFRRTHGPHVRWLSLNRPGCFTVVSAAVTEMLMIEDEIVTHQTATRSFDRPDISIGRTWAVHRRGRGLADSADLAPLYLPDQKLDVEVRVYDGSEWSSFQRWFRGVYLVEKLHPYFSNKPEMKAYEPVAVASVADAACRELSGRPANLPEKKRAALDAAGGTVHAKPAIGGTKPRRLPPK